MDNDGNQKMVIIENIVEDSIEVNYENKSITYSPYISLDLLNMAIKSINFFRVKIFYFIINPLLIDVTNNWRQMRRNFMLCYKDTSFKTGSSYKSFRSICLFGVEDFKFQLLTWGKKNFKWKVWCRIESSICFLDVRCF